MSTTLTREVPNGEAIAWMKRGACGDDPDLWFSEEPKDIAAAQAACSTCPVRSYCHAWSLSHPTSYGVWAGEDRGRRRRRDAAKAGGAR